MGVHHQIIVERILSHTERIKDRFDKEGKSPYTLAIEVDCEDTKNFLRRSGAKSEKDFEVIHSALEEQIKQFDGFLEESVNRGDKRETITILTRQADLQLLDNPIVTIKILNCKISLCFEISSSKAPFSLILLLYHSL